MADTENSTPAAEQRSVRDVKLEAKLTAGESELTIKYTVTNSSKGDIYLLDATPGVEQSSRTAFADLKSFYLSYREPSTAFVLKGIPPLPSDKSVSMRVMPLGTKLAPGENIEREFVMPMPLRERSDWYYPPLPPEEYTIGSVDRVIFNIQYLRSGAEGFHVMPAHYAEGFFIVGGSATVNQAQTLTSDFTIEKTMLFVRKDRFNRL